MSRNDEALRGSGLALAEPHAPRATPVGTSRVAAPAWFGALDVPWGTDVVSASAFVERYIDVTRESWTRPSRAVRDLRPLRGSTPLLVETRAPRTVSVQGWGLVPWSLTSPVVAWAALMEWVRVRGPRQPEAGDRGVPLTAWERAHDDARWELTLDVFACEVLGDIRHAGSFMSCVAADGAPIRVDDTVLFERHPLPAPYDGVGFATALLAAVSAVHAGTATAVRSGRAGTARRFLVSPCVGGPAHPEDIPGRA